MDKLLDPISLYIVGGLLAILLIVLLLRTSRTSRKAAPAWAVTLALGLVVGCGATLLAMHGYGYHWESQFDLDGAAAENSPEGVGGPGLNAPAMGGPAMGGAGGGGMGMAGMGGMGMSGGLGGESNAAGRSRRQLTTLVGKLDLLTGGLPFELSSDQTQKLTSSLAKLDSAEELPDDEADEQLEAINAIFTADQKKTLDAFSLPRPAGGGGGGFGGGGFGGGPPGGGAPGAGNAGRRPPLEGAAPSAAGGQGERPSVSANPFREGDSQKKLRDLLGRLGGDESPAPEAQDNKTEADKEGDNEAKAPEQPPLPFTP